MISVLLLLLLRDCIFAKESVVLVLSNEYSCFISYKSDMSLRFLLLGVVSIYLSLSISAEAQRLDRGQIAGDNHSCVVVDKGLMKRLRLQWEVEDALRGLSSRPENLNKSPFIRNDKRVTYLLRVAIGISAEGLNHWLNNDENRIPQYLNELETELNMYYERDCGIRMELIRSDKLYLWKNPNTPYRPEWSDGTRLISEAIGVDNYDLGIILTGNNGGLQGLASLGGVQSKYSKADGIAIGEPTTMAHELGHLLGAEHTHDRAAFTIQIEPGNGRSIMSYGTRAGRTFFALPSIQVMRHSCGALKLYNRARTEIIDNGDIGDETINSAVVLPFIEEMPRLRKDQLKPDYKVPVGTYFQFHLPTENPQKGFRYNAHLNDRVKEGQSNVLQCFYESVNEPYVMYHPRYSVAVNKWYQNRWQYGVDLIPYSDAFRTGVYTYVLSASNKGQHDNYITRLHIVDGEAFRVTQVTGIDPKTNKAIAGGEVSVSWQPAHQLYRHHKVRILLSDDFGKTFKYVLADNVSNTGSWSGFWPYITIGKVDYPSYTNAARQNPIRGVRGGVIKVEVIGEVAYGLSHIQPYIVQEEVISTGGFLLEASANKSIKFSREDGLPIPPHYLEVQRRVDVETQPNLRATFAGQSQVVEGDERAEGNVLIRTWRATIGQVTSTYTQTIKIIEEEYVEPDYLRNLKALADQARDLYQHIGDLAYPRADLPLSLKFKQSYSTIYDETGAIKPHLTRVQAEAFANLLEQFAELADEDIVMPISDVKYYIVSYARTYTGDKRYYLTAQPDNDWDKERLELQKVNATPWTHREIDGVHHFTYGEHSLHLDQTLRNKKGARLVRGVTWGAFSILSYGSDPRIAQASNSGKSISFGLNYSADPINSRINGPGDLVSTDFQLELVDEGFDIYFETKTWTSLTASFLGAKATTILNPTAEGGNRYRIHIPSGCGSERIRFSASSGESIEVRLSGRSQTYSELGGRCHRLVVPSSRYTTLYLDYAVSLPPGVKAFTAKLQNKVVGETGQSNSYELQLTPISGGAIPVRTPVIVYAQTSGVYELIEAVRAIDPVRENDLVGAMTAVVVGVRDEDYHYYDLSSPRGNLDSEQERLTYPLLVADATIPRNTAYLTIYKYENNNYIAPQVAMSVSELSKEPQEPAVPSPPETPNDPPIAPPLSPPTDTPPPPSDPNDATGNEDSDDTQDEDNEDDGNGSDSGGPNQPDALITERGTLDRPYSVRGLSYHQVADSQSIWVRGQVVGWLDANGRLVSRTTTTIALGADQRTYIPVYIPKIYQKDVASLLKEELFVEGRLSQYLHRRGIAPDGFRSLRVQGRALLPPDDAIEHNNKEQSPNDWQGLIYNLNGQIVGRGNFRDLPRGIYILGGKKFIKL